MNIQIYTIKSVDQINTLLFQAVGGSAFYETSQRTEQKKTLPDKQKMW